MKRIFAMLLTVAMVLSMVPAQAFATEPTEETVVETTAPETEQTESVPTAESTLPPEEETGEPVPTQAPTEPSAVDTAPVEKTADVPETTGMPPAETETASLPEDGMDPEEIISTGSYTLTGWDTTGEALTNDYLNYLFYGANSGIVPFGTGARDRLSEANQFLYDALKPIIEEIAAGNRTSTRIALVFEESEIPEGEMDLLTVMSALFSDCPFALYWFGGYYAWASGITRWSVTLYPADCYSASTSTADNPEVNVTKMKNAAAAAENAKSIVRQYSGYSDYDKVAAYADTICSLVEYDYDALDGNYGTGNPWGLVNVFDKDTSTNVVCEGYAEAFQYLFDLSTFQGDIQCYSVTGANHKWNIVRINGISYLLDVTHIDGGSYADKTAKFLDGAPGSVDNGYTVGNFYYWYYDDTIALFGRGPNSILRLSDKKYSVSANPKPQNRMTQAEFEIALKNCGGSYRLTKCVTLTSDLEISGVDVTIANGGWITTSRGVDLVIQRDASVTVESGGEFCVDNHSTCVVWGELTARNGGKVIEDGTLYDLDSELVQYLSERCGSMTADQIRRQLQYVDSEALLAELLADFYTWWDYQDYLELLEPRTGGPAAVVLEEDVTFFTEDSFEVQGATLNMPVDATQPIRVKVGHKDISGSDYLVGFSLELENVKTPKYSPVPLDVTIHMPVEYASVGLKLLKYKPDGSTEEVKSRMTTTIAEDEVKFVITELGDFALDYSKTGTLGSNISWSFDPADGTMTISGQGAIPNYVKWGNLNDKIRRVVIEEGITALGIALFRNIKSLEEVSLPASLSLIEGETFRSSGLKSIVIPQNVTNIGDNAFGYITTLTSVVFQGNAPEFSSKYTNKYHFGGVTATVYYPAGNATWTEAVRQNYGGTLTWVAGCTNGHTIVVEKGRQPTCTEPGISDGKTCSACGAVLAVPSELEPLGHDLITDKEVPATCTAPGHYSGARCSRCDYTEGGGMIPALGHMEVVDAYVAPTCTQTGLTEGKHCSRCDAVLVKQNTISANGHSFENAICTVCGAYEILEGTCDMDLTWRLDQNGKLTVSGEGVMWDTPWEEYALRIRSVEIGDGVTTLDYDAFRGCANLTEVSLPDSLTSIYPNAFRECTALTAIDIPQSVTEIGFCAFYGCTNLISVNIPYGVEVIEFGTFEECSSLKQIHIPSSVKEISSWAFRASALTDLVVPEGVHTIGMGAFRSCSGLKTVSLPKSLTTIEEDLFTDCTGLTTVNIPTGLSEIGRFMFSGCASLISVTIPRNIKAIGDGAFSGCVGLTEITIPASVTSIGQRVFVGCNNLKAIKVNSSNKYFSNDNSGVLFSKDKTVLFQIPGGYTGSYTIPEKVTTVAYGAAVNSVNLSGIVFPSTLGIIEDYAFSGCTALTDAWFQGNAPAIAADAFGETTLTARYPAGDATWTEAVRQNYGGSVTWLASCVNGHAEVVQPGVAPTCTEDGISDGKYCSACGDILVRQEVIPALGHDEVVDAYVAPTCVENGLTEGKHCARCGIVFVSREEISALGHSVVADAYKAPTCTEIGLTEGSHCERCAEVFVAQEAIPALGHDFADGICQRCGAPDKADYDLFSGKSLSLKPINPATGKAYTSKQLIWSMDSRYEPFATLKNGKLTAKVVLERVRAEVKATVVATGEEITYLVDIFPAVTQLEVFCDGEVVNGKTLNLDFGQKKLVLTADAYPLDTLENIQWTVSDKKLAYAEDYIISGNSVIVVNPTGKAGTVTVKATVNAGVKKTVTVKLQFAKYAQEVRIETPSRVTIVGGESLQLYADIIGGASKPGITWSIPDKTDKTAASISTKGLLKAKQVKHPESITVVATSKDGKARDSVEITILPSDYDAIYLMHEEQCVTGLTAALNVGNTSQLKAYSQRSGEETVSWKSSKPSVATVSSDGLITAVGPGTAKITAEKYGQKPVFVNIKVTTLVSDMTISTKDGKNLVTENGETLVEIASSKSATLAATVYPAKANKAVTWEIIEGGTYAKISASGKITANKDLTSVKYVTVRATAKDGSGYSETIRVRIRPLATGVQIYSQQSGGTTFSVRTPENWWVRSNTTLTVDLDDTGSLKLLSHVYPYYGENNDRNAIQGVTWKSSNGKTASIDADGNVIFYKTGTVTITATAKDGSGKKVTFKLKIV